MSLDGAITNLASWAGNTMMPTMAGLFFAGAVYRYSKGGPFEQLLYGGFASLMCSGICARWKVLCSRRESRMPMRSGQRR
jgi:hypothetical protein